MVAWAEDCLCYIDKADLRGASRHHRATGFKHRFDSTGCPMRTMRAPELATNKLRDLLVNLLNEEHANFLLDPTTARLTEAEQSVVVRDYASRISVWVSC